MKTTEVPDLSSLLQSQDSRILSSVGVAWRDTDPHKKTWGRGKNPETAGGADSRRWYRYTPEVHRIAVTCINAQFRKCM